MIGLINYGLGNIQAFLNLYQRLHIPAKIINSENDLDGITKLILPGVGHFDHAMNLLNESGLKNIIEKKVFNEKMPILGICVGMQMLARRSDEGSLEGLGWIDGEVKDLKKHSSNETDLPLPHMGWNDVKVDSNVNLFKDFSDNPKFYFLHSYYFECLDNKNVIATTKYIQEFSCIVKMENVYGVQFHPEKSHKHGQLLLKNFWDYC